MYYFVSSIECLYRYIKQPPSNIFVDAEGLVPLCNPYSGHATVRIQCQVSVPASVVADILWFYEDQQISDTVGPTSSVQLVNSGGIITSTITFGGTSFNDMYRGSYHCQVVVDGNTDSTALSNSLVLETQLSYITANPCMGQVLAEANNSCAEATSPSSSPPPESPPPSTTTLAGEMNVTDSNVTDPDRSGTTAAASASEGTLASSTLEFTAEPDNSRLRLWVYVLVAIAAVFGMIIVVLAILCVGLCLKKNKTEDTYKREFATKYSTCTMCMYCMPVSQLSQWRPLKSTALPVFPLFSFSPSFFPFFPFKQACSGSYIIVHL